MLTILNKLRTTHSATREELLALLNGMTPELETELFQAALTIKTQYYDDTVFMRGLIEISNICSQNCAYCGIRKDNPCADRYRLSKEDILECCEEGYQLGFRTFVLQGGEDGWFTDDRLTDILRTIKIRWPEVAITLSLGERSYESYQALHEAGADRYLLRHETASPELYSKHHPGMSFDNRVQCLKNLKAIGYQVGAGFMVGLPGQTTADLVEDLLFLKELQPQMVGIGPFIPHRETPLGDEPGGTVHQAVIMVALVRLLLPEALLPSTTALGTLDPMGREKALNAGANVVMPNLSPQEQRVKYAIYENKAGTGEEAAQSRDKIQKKIEAAGFRIDMGRGDHTQFRR